MNNEPPILEENINREIRIAILLCCYGVTMSMDEIASCVGEYEHLKGFGFNVIRRIIHALVTAGTLTANGAGASRVFRTNDFGYNYLASEGIPMAD